MLRAMAAVYEPVLRPLEIANGNAEFIEADKGERRGELLAAGGMTSLGVRTFTTA